MASIWWLVTIVLFAVGLIGTVVPVVPGPTIVCAAVVLHRVMVGPQKSVNWWIVGLIVALTLLSYGFEFVAGYFGAKRFGATKWGALGAVLGGIGGIFFGLPGLFIGPIVGAIALEFVAGRKMVAAGKAGWGTLLGNLAGMLAKLIIAASMIVIFLMNVPSPF
ncbi:MAG: DUF456 family protein [Verrucomicrobiota bacterium]|nr:DUF456 family protein [Verrucomicrobiota bacterium]